MGTLTTDQAAALATYAAGKVDKDKAAVNASALMESLGPLLTESVLDAEMEKQRAAREEKLGAAELAEEIKP